MKNVAIIVAALLTGLLFVQFIRLRDAAANDTTAQFARKANLALRRTAHFLLAETGDSTSRISPVRQTSATTFLVRLEAPFRYARLPALLQESLTLYGIQTSYDVAVLDCAHGELQLGYTIQDLIGEKGIPCVGRQQSQGCHTLQVTFAKPETPIPSATLLWAVGLGVLITGLGYVGWQRVIPTPPPFITVLADQGANDSRIQLGQSWFSMENQSVNVAGVLHPLTYREAKLLHFFSNHPNQVVERDFILKSVWQDEGVIVGRSVDVFVSRLRKLLHHDATLKITAVHGVGYRLSVQEAVQHNP